MKRVLIFRGRCNPPNVPAEALLKLLQDSGCSAELGGNNPTLITNQNEIVFFNGQTKPDLKAISRCKEKGISHCFLEVGFFSQRDHFLLSRVGSVGTSLLLDEEINPITPEEHAMLNCLFLSYSKGQVYSGGEHIIAMLQMEKDTAIKNYSPYRTMQQFVNAVEDKYQGEKIKYRAHPRERGISLITKNEIVRSGSLWNDVLTAKLCVGINSTTLYEAVLAGVPTVSLGGSPLYLHPQKHRAIVREIILRQIPLSGCSNIDYRIHRSLGRPLW